jgi:hypothetical protein
VRQLNVSIEVKKGGERKQKCGVRKWMILIKSVDGRKRES